MSKRTSSRLEKNGQSTLGGKKDKRPTKKAKKIEPVVPEIKQQKPTVVKKQFVIEPRPNEFFERIPGIVYRNGNLFDFRMYENIVEATTTKAVSEESSTEESPSSLVCNNCGGHEFEEVEFEEYFFLGTEEKEVPDSFDKEKDSYFLDASDTNHDTVASYRDKGMNSKFSRDITTFDDGEILSKHCEPWGPMAILYGAELKLTKKIFNAKGDVRFVEVTTNPFKYKDHPTRVYTLEAAFFKGWLSQELRNDYFDYCYKNGFRSQ